MLVCEVLEGGEVVPLEGLGDADGRVDETLRHRDLHLLITGGQDLLSGDAVYHTVQVT